MENHSQQTIPRVLLIREIEDVIRRENDAVYKEAQGLRAFFAKERAKLVADQPKRKSFLPLMLTVKKVQDPKKRARRVNEPEGVAIYWKIRKFEMKANNPRNATQRDIKD